MIKLLAIDTSINACSAALISNNTIHEEFVASPQQHTRLLLPMIQQLLQQTQLQLNQLDALAFSQGPGSFTGIRVATAVIQGLALSSNLPIVPVSSLQMLAQGIYRNLGYKKIIVNIDAHMRAIYWGGYELNADNLMMPIILDQVCTPENFILPAGTWVGVGNGWQAYPEFEMTKNKLTALETDFYPHAQDVASLALFYLQQGKTVTAIEAAPVYLRGTELWKKMQS